MTLFWVVFWGGLTVLAVAAGVTLHARRRELFESVVPPVDDEAVRRILATGQLAVDEPLDLEEIDQEEQRFWSESWDEPED
ncbi:MAG TPA: hypothetical protein VFQ22_11805 [Longimicrobiales bacterium]|nr:hypothetical protein [Longimicrobiales bacterium]